MVDNVYFKICRKYETNYSIIRTGNNILFISYLTILHVFTVIYQLYQEYKLVLWIKMQL